MKKYEFTGETKTITMLFRNVTLHRIRAIVDFGIVKVGDLGGWIEDEKNLSHEGTSWISGNAEIWGDAEILGNADISGNAKIWGNAKILGNAEIFKTTHVLVIGPIGSRNSYTTFFRDKDNETTVNCGCFHGKIDKFLKKVKETHGKSNYAIVYRKTVEIAKIQIDLSEVK